MRSRSIETFDQNRGPGSAGATTDQFLTKPTLAKWVTATYKSTMGSSCEDCAIRLNATNSHRRRLAMTRIHDGLRSVRIQCLLWRRGRRESNGQQELCDCCRLQSKPAAAGLKDTLVADAMLFRYSQSSLRAPTYRWLNAARRAWWPLVVILMGGAPCCETSAPIVPYHSGLPVRVPGASSHREYEGAPPGNDGSILDLMNQGRTCKTTTYFEMTWQIRLKCVPKLANWNA